VGSGLLALGPLLVRLADVSPAASAFWRLAVAVPIVAALALPRPGSPGLPRRMRALGLGCLAGLLFALDLLAWHHGIVRTTSANATLLANSAAFLLAGWGILILGERPHPATRLALLLAAPGLVLLLGTSAEVSPAHLLGDLLSLLAAVFYAGYLLLVRALGAALDARTILAVSTVSGALVLLPVALAAPGAFWPADWRPVVALALSSQVAGQGLLVYASARLAATLLGLGLLIQPVASALVGWAVLGERLSALQLAGAALVLGGLALVRR